MVYNPELHEIDPVTGFAVHKGTNAPVGIVPAPFPVAEFQDYPKWVVVHGSHVVGDIAPEWGQSHRPRGGEVMVLVNNEDEEAAAGREKENKENAPEDNFEGDGRQEEIDKHVIAPEGMEVPEVGTEYEPEPSPAVSPVPDAAPAIGGTPARGQVPIKDVPEYRDPPPAPVGSPRKPPVGAAKGDGFQ